jgi:hypothetical protein
MIFHKIFLQEKAVEATKQEKERKEEKTLSDGRHRIFLIVPHAR